MNVLDVVENIGILPVINITEMDTAVPLAETLVECGIPVIEVTLRNEKSLDAIKAIRSACPEMGIISGTVLSVEQAEKALDAGANGLVMPGYDEEIIDYALEKGISIVPGCVTAADIQRGVKKGLTVFKFFPCEQCGGLATMKFLSSAFKGIKFLPTGGIGYDDLDDYLKHDFIAACGGSYMANAKDLQDRDFDRIREKCKKAVNMSLGFRLAHIGLNSNCKEDALELAKSIAEIFGFDIRQCGGSTFAGTAVECMNNQRFGEKGHIGFSVNSIHRATAALTKKGVSFDLDSIKRDGNGQITCIYLKEQFGGFAFHIVKSEERK